MYVSTLLVSSDTPEEGIRSHCRWLWATMRLLGIELMTFRRAASALNRGAISPAPGSSLLLFFVCLFFRHRVSLYSPGCPGTHSVDQAGLELRNLPASASQVLGLKACTIMPGYYEYLLHSMYPCGGSIGKRPQLPDKSLCQQWQLRTRVLPIYLLTAVDHSLCTHPCQHWTALCHKEQITSLSCGTESLKGGKPRIISHI
jgi:hypothetical protein